MRWNFVIGNEVFSSDSKDNCRAVIELAWEEKLQVRVISPEEAKQLIGLGYRKF